MKRYISGFRPIQVDDPKIDAFLEEVVSVCRKHGLSLGPHDCFGLLEVVPFCEEEAENIMDSRDGTGQSGA